MAKTNFKFDRKGVDDLQAKIKSIGEGLTNSQAKRLGKKIVSLMKKLIRRGVSPMLRRAGSRAQRFPKYKNPKRYPGKLKPHSPVNLKLDGDFLRDLSASSEAVSRPKGFGALIFYSTELSQKKESGHRTGQNSQPKRPTIPSRTGETFAPKIQKEITKFVNQAISKKTKG